MTFQLDTAAVMAASGVSTHNGDGQEAQKLGGMIDLFNLADHPALQTMIASEMVSGYPQLADCLDGIRRRLLDQHAASTPDLLDRLI